MFALTPFKTNRTTTRRDLFDIDRWLSGFNFANSNAEPAMPIRSWETNEAYFVEADLAGVTKEDVEVTLPDEHTLRIAATRQETKTDGTNHYQETYYGRTERNISLPFAVTEDGCTASMNNGVLKLMFKKSAGSKTRRIAVK